MEYGGRSLFRRVACAPGLFLAAAAVLAPRDGLSGSYESGAGAPEGPRWSNESHLMNGIVSVPGCVALRPGQGADYIPGRDARGGPVPPADSHTGHHAAPPVELEIELGRRRAGGRRLDLGSGPMVYDPAFNTLNGHPLSRDCTPRLK